MSGAIKKIVAYYRVSTKKQGESGLGLEGSPLKVRKHGKTLGLAEFVAELAYANWNPIAKYLYIHCFLPPSKGWARRSTIGSR